MSKQASSVRRGWVVLKRLLSRAWGTRMVWGFVRGDGVYLPNTRVSNTAAIFAVDRLQVEDHVFIGHFSVLDATFGLNIGEGCQIGFFTGIFTHSSHAAIRLYGRSYVEVEQKDGYFTGAVEIGAFSFVGAHATILPGTRLGRGTLVSAYSLVKGNYPDFAIISGNPAVIVGDTRDMDSRLLKKHPHLVAHYCEWAGVDPSVFEAGRPK